MSEQVPPKTPIRDVVMQDIQAGKVTMKPRVYFGSLMALAALTTIAAGLAIAYLTSIVYFWLRIITSGTMAYGARSRLSEALATFPWWLLLAAVALGIAAILLVRRQGHMYRHRTSALVVILVLASLLLGVGFSALNIGQPYAQQHTPMMQQQHSPTVEQHGNGYRRGQQ